MAKYPESLYFLCKLGVHHSRREKLWVPSGKLGIMNEFYSIYSQGMVRVAACTLPVALADPMTNAQRTVDLARELDAQGVALAVFPELGLTGYSIDDLFLQDIIISKSLEAIEYVRAASRALRVVLVVGAPLRNKSRLYNCGVVIHAGNVLGVAPKSYLPNYREFYEKRYFASGIDQVRSTIELPGVSSSALEDLEAMLSGEPEGAINVDGAAPFSVPFGPDLLFTCTDLTGFRFFVEVCEDMWVPIPPAARASLLGATVIANLSGSPITVGRALDRELLIGSASSRYHAAYIYAANSAGESTNDLTWDGQTIIFENGEKLADGGHFISEPHATIADVDLESLLHERLAQSSFDDNRHAFSGATAGSSWNGDLAFRDIFFRLNPPTGDIGLRRATDRFPFVPNDSATLSKDCLEAYNIQVSALCQRLRSIGSPKIIIGVSGGLDSTHALLVAAKVMDQLNRPRTDILAYTMPGFATSDHTKANAYRLGESLGVSFKEIDIREAARQMLKEMDHPFGNGEPVYDVTFENVQAGLRTDFLFRLANQHGGIVLGTGDLSELALGWCTFGVGDHMSHYNVNSGVPKTLMQHLIRWVIASEQFTADVSATLQSILDTEISPELVPASEDEPIQSTQAKIGPYELQDFTLHYLVRRGMRPSKIAFYQWHTWRDRDEGSWPVGIEGADRHEYTLAEIKKWMQLFYKRFFANQFKRSTVPNGPKVSAGGAMSPRGDWRMPSDALATAWLEELNRIPENPQI